MKWISDSKRKLLRCYQETTRATRTSTKSAFPPLPMLIDLINERDTNWPEKSKPRNWKCFADRIPPPRTCRGMTNPCPGEIRPNSHKLPAWTCTSPEPDRMNLTAGTKEDTMNFTRLRDELLATSSRPETPFRSSVGLPFYLSSPHPRPPSLFFFELALLSAVCVFSLSRGETWSGVRFAWSAAATG